MLGWNELHPYNAVHVLRRPEALDVERLARVIDGTLESLGLTNLVLSSDNRGFEYHGGPMPQLINMVRPGSSVEEALRREIEQQINTRFDFRGRFSPFRFFVVPDGPGFFLGLAYFHAVADAQAIVQLLRILLRRYVSGQRAPEREDIQAYPLDGSDGVVRDAIRTARKLATIPSMIGQMRRSHHPRVRDPQDLTSALNLFSLPESAVPRLMETSRAWKVTINDLFLVILMRSLSPLAADRVRRERRLQIALGTIVNTRSDLGLNGRSIFGLFLGSFVVHHEAPDTASLRQIALDVRQQTARIKRKKLYLSTAELSISRFLLSFYSTEKRKKLYQKHYPLWGGITNMNLNAIWNDEKDAGPDEYLRTVSTGPVTPLVLSVTTVRERINAALSYRPSVFSREDIAGVQSRLVDLICGLDAAAE